MSDLSYRYPNPVDQATMRPRDHEERISALERLVASLPVVPIGGVISYFNTTNFPPGFELCDGTAVIDAETRFPTLWARAPSSTKSGSNFIKPDHRSRVSVGWSDGDADFGTILGLGGQRTVALSAAQSGLPAHGHNDTFAVSTSSSTHSHQQNLPTIYSGTTPSNPGSRIGGGGSNGIHYANNGSGYTTFDGVINTDTDGAHNHTLTGGVSTKSAENASQAHNNIQPFIVLAKLIRIF